MTRTNLLARRGLRSKRAISHLPAAQLQTAVIPASREALNEAHVWAVNAAFESGQDELAYELADRYLTA